MIRIFARRPILFVALFMLLGIFLVVLGLENSTLLPFLITMAVLFVGVATSFLVSAIVKHKNKFVNFLNLNKVVLMFCLLFYMFGGFLSFIKVTSFEQQIDDSEYSVVAKVESVGFFHNQQTIILNEVEIENESFSSKLKGKTELRISGDEDCYVDIEVGNIVSYVGTFTATNVIDDNKLNYYAIKSNIKFSSTMNDKTTFKILDNGSLNVNDKIRFNILDNLLGEMPSDLAYLSFSIMFGDASYLSDFTDESFKISGVSHIVAVSGMNVVIIVSVLLFMFRFIKCKKFIKFLIITLVLIGYCYLCDYTPSVVRATIMALVVLSASFLGRQNDILSSLGLSAMLISIIWPLSIYDVGFLLSFASVVGIVLFCSPMTKFLNDKCKFPTWLASGIAVTLSAQIGIYPIMASYFNVFSVYSILANIVVVPVFSLAYILLFTMVVITTILPFLSFLLVVPAVVMSFVNWFPSLFVDLPFATVYVFDMEILTIFFYIFLLFASSFVFLKNKFKIPIVLMLTIAIAILFIGQLLPNKFNKDNVNEFNTYGAVHLITTTQNEKILVGVGTKYDITKILQKLQSKKIHNLNLVVLFDKKVNAYDERANLEKLLEVCSVDKVLMLSQKYYAFKTLNSMKDEIYLMENEETISVVGTKICFIYYEEEILSIMMMLGSGKNIMFVKDANEDQCSFLSLIVDEECDVFCYDKNDYIFFDEPNFTKPSYIV